MSERVQPPLGVCGLGLVGGSFALAQRRCGRTVIGIDTNPASASHAVAIEACDAAGQDPAMLADCEAVLIAGPVGATADILQQLTDAGVSPRAIFDAGSTKLDAQAAAQACLGEKASCFVASHPIAGAEHSGIAAATHQLFAGKQVITCPVSSTDPNALQLTESLWASCGAKVERLDASDHDRILASVSHLPHVLSYALVGTLFRSPDHAELMRFAASGFRDFTRIASSDPVMWRDICLKNRDHLLAAISSYSEDLASLQAAIEARDSEKLHEYFSEVRRLRNGWLAEQQ